MCSCCIQSKNTDHIATHKSQTHGLCLTAQWVVEVICFNLTSYHLLTDISVGSKRKIFGHWLIWNVKSRKPLPRTHWLVCFYAAKYHQFSTDVFQTQISDQDLSLWNIGWLSKVTDNPNQIKSVDFHSPLHWLVFLSRMAFVDTIFPYL